jgi:hypothetical protein
MLNARTMVRAGLGVGDCGMCVGGGVGSSGASLVEGGLVVMSGD